MIFWDSSAILPLLLKEKHSASMRKLAHQDTVMVVWWGTAIECLSAFARLRREKVISLRQEEELRRWLSRLGGSWIEIEPGAEIRTTATRLLSTHPLRASDVLQLAAALVWAGGTPDGHRLACLDEKLAGAARMEGFSVLPEQGRSRTR
jgi:hypothetical protein